MQPILTFLILFSTFTMKAGGVGSTAQKINYKIVSCKAKDGYIKAFIKEANMIITLTFNPNMEIVFMENRWVHYNSSSAGALVKTANKNQYQWNPINNYNKERNQCVETTSEKLINTKYIRTFWIDINHGQEKLVIVAEKINAL